MNGVKKILFGIALILLGFFCMYASSLGEWGIGEVIALILSVFGIGFAIAGLVDKKQ